MEYKMKAVYIIWQKSKNTSILIVLSLNENTQSIQTIHLEMWAPLL